MNGFKTVELTDFEFDLLEDAVRFRAREYSLLRNQHRHDFRVQQLCEKSLRELAHIRDKLQIARRKA